METETPPAGQTAASLFDPAPEQWGLRGDPFLWEDMQAHFEAHSLPMGEPDFEAAFRALFRELTGKELGAEPHHFVRRYARAGMSSGGISHAFWRDTALPLLLGRLRERCPDESAGRAKRFGKKRPATAATPVPGQHAASGQNAPDQPTAALRDAGSPPTTAQDAELSPTPRNGRKPTFGGMVRRNSGLLWFCALFLPGMSAVLGVLQYQMGPVGALRSAFGVLLMPEALAFRMGTAVCLFFLLRAWFFPERTRMALRLLSPGEDPARLPELLAGLDRELAACDQRGGFYITPHWIADKKGPFLRRDALRGYFFHNRRTEPMYSLAVISDRMDTELLPGARLLPQPREVAEPYPGRRFPRRLQRRRCRELYDLLCDLHPELPHGVDDDVGLRNCRDMLAARRKYQPLPKVRTGFWRGLALTVYGIALAVFVMVQTVEEPIPYPVVPDLIALAALLVFHILYRKLPRPAPKVKKPWYLNHPPR